MSNNKKKILLSVAIILFGLTLVSGTYAFFTIAATTTNGNYNVASRCFNIIYDATNEDGTMDISGTLKPSTSYKDGLSGKIAIGIDPSCDVYAHGDILLYIDSTSSILTQTVEPHCENVNTLETLVGYNTSSDCTSQEYGVWVTDGSALKYAVYEEGNTESVSVGYVNSVNEAISLYSDFRLSNKTNSLTNEYYTVYLWLDGHLIDNSYASVPLSGYMYADATQYMYSIPETPVLDPGMIPVTIANDGTVTTISANDSNWYDYYANEWANVVLVNSESRSKYLNTSGVSVTLSDILAYYVWIPRYKYQILNTDTKLAVNPQTINIIFEDSEDKVSNGNAVGQYLTHPAFMWDGEPVSGIWVGKFETSTEETSICYTSSSKTNCDNTEQLPRILPNVKSLRYQSVGNQFKTSLKFANGILSDTNGVVTFVTDSNNIYGLNSRSNVTDSHMMKNSEWGAVLYLAHSYYGINKEIRLNNNSSFLTGCGASNANAQSKSTCEIEYGKSSSYPQSTTGNITGVFDMSGGSWEYVMANYGNNVGESSFDVIPEKYYNLYTTTLCNFEECSGHALYETKGWYRDSYVFTSSDYPWFSRGGYLAYGFKVGAFYANHANGKAVNGYSWRSVVVIDN